MPRSFGDLASTFGGAPPSLGVLLAEVDVGKGRETLYRDQMPELLRSLAEQTRVESIKASVAIEGVEVPTARAERLAAEAPPKFRNRDEREFAGYRDAIDGVIRARRLTAPTPASMLALHRKLYAHTEVTGGPLKTEDNVIGESNDGVMTRVIFWPPPWGQTPGLIEGLFSGYREAVDGQAAHPLLLISALVLDLLAIHPFEDGNDRVARLLTTHELLRFGYGVARYTSIEQRIFESKSSYYLALEESQRDWHDGAHSVWPWAQYLITILAECYRDFEARVAAEYGSASMGKSERVAHWVENAAPSEFTLADARRAVPGISDGTIRNAFKALVETGKLTPPPSGGPGAVWKRA